MDEPDRLEAILAPNADIGSPHDLPPRSGRLLTSLHMEHESLAMEALTMGDDDGYGRCLLTSGSVTEAWILGDISLSLLPMLGVVA